MRCKLYARNATKSHELSFEFVACLDILRIDILRIRSDFYSPLRECETCEPNEGR
jgi:hypothetical protein